MDSTSPENDRRRGTNLSGVTGKILVAAACLLIVGAITYGSAIALRGVWQSQQREDPAAVRARTLEDLRRMGKALHERAQQDAAGQAEAPQVDGQPSE